LKWLQLVASAPGLAYILGRLFVVVDSLLQFKAGAATLNDSASSGYSPSPRPTYDAPALVRRNEIKHHVWGDPQSGLVGDWLYASTQRLHVIEFGLAPGRWFKHSPAFRTVFAADEVFYVLQGAMLACNPQTGEVVECLAGESLFFRRDTWHHVRAQGAEPLRVLEFFAPPPAQGTSGSYAVKQEYLETPVYRRDELLGNCIGAAKLSTLHRIGARERSLRLEGEIAVGLIASTEHLTVAELQVPAGAAGERTAHGGDALLVGLSGELMIRTHWKSNAATFALGPRDAVFIPETGQYEVLSFSGPATALLGVAPRYLP
jgi:mannose-6-phosphate isomerase-like protein (cupin superfamily)